MGETDGRSHTELCEALVVYVESLTTLRPEPECLHRVTDEYLGRIMCLGCELGLGGVMDTGPFYEDQHYEKRKGEKRGRREKETPKRLGELGVGVLKRTAKSLKIKGYSKYKSNNKNELLKLILGHERMVVQHTRTLAPPLEHLTVKTPVRPSMKEVWWFRGEKAMAVDVRGHSTEEFVENDIPRILERMPAGPQLRHHVLASRGETDKEVVKMPVRTRYGYGLGAQREEGLMRAGQVYRHACAVAVQHILPIAESIHAERHGCVVREEHTDARLRDGLLPHIGDRVGDFGLLDIQSLMVPGRALEPRWQTILENHIVRDIAECLERADSIKLQTILELGVGGRTREAGC